MQGNVHIRRAPRLEDSHGTPLVPGDKVALHYGDEVSVGTVTIEETYVIRADAPRESGQSTETLRHWPNERLAELRAARMTPTEG